MYRLYLLVLVLVIGCNGKVVGYNTWPDTALIQLPAEYKIVYSATTNKYAVRWLPDNILLKLETPSTMRPYVHFADPCEETTFDDSVSAVYLIKVHIKSIEEDRSHPIAPKKECCASAYK